MKPFYLLLSITLLHCNAMATQWTVGPGLTYTAPSKVSGLVQDGDTVNIMAAVYTGDVCLWSANNLLLRGVGGMAQLDANGTAYGEKAIWVINGDNYTIQYVEFYNCSIPDSEGNNGAGIRLQAGTITISHCYFHDNQDGILTDADSTGDILIEYSEFAHNGAGDGYSHNMYIGHSRSFTLRYCYSHLANAGHEVKTRAYRNYILYNRIMDEDTGKASYEIDMPNGGEAFVIGNLIQKGTLAENPYSVTFGEEGYADSTPSLYAGGADTLKALYFVNNTMVNQLTKHGPGFVRVAAGATTVEVMNNLYLGPGTFLTSADTTLLTNNLAGTAFDLVDTATFDYHLTPLSQAIDAGANPGTVDTFSLAPIAEYVYPDSSQPRGICGKTIDIGAYEYPSTRYDTITKTICNGDSLNGHNATGMYTDTFVAIGGCDSVVMLNLTVDTVAAPTIAADSIGNINGSTVLTSSPGAHYQWYTNDSLLPGDTNSTIGAWSNNVYYEVQVTDSNGCKSPLGSFVFSGINNIVSQHQLTLYPNPTNGPVSLAVAGLAGNEPVTLKIFNALGQKVLEQTQSSPGSEYKTQFNLDGSAKGVFLVQIQQGSWMAASRVVLQ